uniref:Uncharacterized protein n=1 Tax=Oncorhynchus mykiss TaxID=8022 RepID=A0A8C7TYS8_ONCMY
NRDCVICGSVGAVCKLEWAMLGIFFTTHSAVLIEDVPFNEEDMHNDQNPPHIIYDLYNQVGYNCFIAVCLYVVLSLLSCRVLSHLKKISSPAPAGGLLVGRHCK